MLNLPDLLAKSTFSSPLKGIAKTRFWKQEQLLQTLTSKRAKGETGVLLQGTRV
jgi:hypothetical protein